MFVYLDESGDTGWQFSLPYRNGGSSRYLCLAFLFVPRHLRKVPRDIITALYKKYGWQTEKKASTAGEGQKLEFAQTVAEMLHEFPEIKIDCIVANKQNVQDHIREDPNKLYNYMCRLVIPEYVKHLDKFEFVPDKRSIKLESGNSLSEYLQMVLWFDCHPSKTKLENNPQESTKNYNLQFVDWIANCVWSHFEDGKSPAFDKINHRIKIRRLYFQ